MLKILHFADAHIDMVNFGPRDPKTGLPARVVDYLKSLDTIIATAIDEKVDLVIFAGDAYRDRSPNPTFQREWERRIMRLSKASIPTLLLTGNHDISPTQLRAHALQEFDTLAPAFIHVVSQPSLLRPQDLDGVPVQIIALPWVTASGYLANMNSQNEAEDDAAVGLEDALSEFVRAAKAELDPDLPTLLTAHASVAGAKFGNEQSIKIGRDVVLQPGMVCDRQFDYVALGHIHKYQDLNAGNQPPVIYPGSIERMNWGEAAEEKGFIVAEVSKGYTEYSWRKLQTRPYIDLSVTLEDGIEVNEKLLAAMPVEEEMANAIVRLTIHYPRNLEDLIDEKRLRNRARLAFAFSVPRDAKEKARSLLPEGLDSASLTSMDLLNLYWKQNHLEEPELSTLNQLAADIITQVESGETAEE